MARAATVGGQRQATDRDERLPPAPAARLLVIEADREAARLTGRALGGAGFAVHHVPTGEEALEYLAADSVAGIVVGHQPPFVDGLQVLRRIRERQAANPVVMLSSAASIGLAVQAIKAGAFDLVERRDDYLPLLVGKVRQALAESRLRAAGHRLARPVFVGRETELRVLDEELARGAGGEGRVVLVSGEEGIGKTSLALEVARRARERACTVLWGQCHETGGAPAYWPWIQILRRYVETADAETLREDLAESAAAVGWITPALRERCPDLPTPDTAALSRFHVVDGVAQFLKRVAGRRPLALVLDDLHRADGDSRYLFRFLATESRDASLLLLGVYRDGPPESPIAAELARVAVQPLTIVLRLRGFEVADVRSYVEAATTVRPSKALVDAIHAKTEGHPLFVAEVTRLLAAAGRLAEQPVNGECRLAVPATRRQAIADRLACLSAGCHALLGVAAVIGHDFATDLLARVAGAAPTTVLDGLEEAVGEQLVCPSDEARAYRFVHVLVREVLYDALEPSDRRRMHGRIAETLASSSGGGAAPLGAESPLAAIAHHSLEAATGPDDLQRAVGWVIAAGDRAAAMMAHEEAARHYDTALRVAERAPLATAAQGTELLVKLAEARWRAGDMPGARDAGRRALAFATEARQPAAIAAAALAFAGRLPGFGAIVSDAEVVDGLEQALALLPPAEAALRAPVMARLAEELAYSPRSGAERTLAQQAIELARTLDDPAVLATVLRTTQWSIWTPDAIERRRRLASEIVALAERTGDRVLALDGELLRLWSALEHGETDVAWGQLARCTRLARELRLPHYAWVTAAARVLMHIATGHLDQAERLAEQAAEAGERADNPSAALFVGAQRVHVTFLRGRFEEVGEWLRSMLASFPLLAATTDCSLISVYARLGQHDRVQTELAALARDDFARVPRTPAWLLNMAFLAEACALIGDVEIARRLYPHLAPFSAYNIVAPTFLLGPVSHFTAPLAALMGDVAGARRHYEDALALEQRTGTRQCVARTQIAYGRLLLQSRCAADRERGARLLASGRTIAEELGLEPAVREADAAVAALPPPEPRRAVFRRVGEDWELAFRGRQATVPHRVGMTYLRCLLERPGVPVPALELASLGGDAILVDRTGGPAIDRQAVAEVQRRIAEIDAAVAACGRRAALVADDLLRERAECAAYLAGRGTELLSAADRARSAVTKAIGRALNAIRGVHEDLAHHLERHVETGRLCVYVPDPATPVTFEP
jgi:CheY-like chemotaxis protein